MARSRKVQGKVGRLVNGGLATKTRAAKHERSRKRKRKSVKKTTNPFNLTSLVNTLENIGIVSSQKRRVSHTKPRRARRRGLAGIVGHLPS